MSKPSSRAIQGLLHLKQHYHRIQVHPCNSRSPFSSYPSRANTFSSSSPPSPFPPNGLFNSLSSASHFPSSDPKLLFSSSKWGFTRFLHCRSFSTKPKAFSSSGLRQFSSKASDVGKRLDVGLAKKVFDKPATAVTSAFSRYREAIGLQIDAFFKRNYLLLIGAGGVIVCALLWRIMFGIANTFVGLSEGMAKYGFLALSSAIVAFAGLYAHSRFTINPDKVYRMAMRKLNTSAGILEVMGAPLSGTDLRAYVMSGGGLTVKNLKPTLRSKRCFLIFPIRGSDRKGLVSVEVKKKKGQYDMKLLAVDIPMASGPDQRLFLIGDEEEYRVGGGLISELRDPVVKAMAATKEFDDLDRIEDEEDAERELQEAERKHNEEIEKLEKDAR
ncbi:hypothetical protein HS088_TW01G00554 [Tripterygium wilfordii]|uniref:Import inner membrane translocase subunit n=1 Tax=Tripterygium wilfordii TaxID=458696 RepID=A0A7J7E267_TRIWF|nr:uncharacterized protein LOC120001142 [Tripterygium wilfordii]KAF5752639.1 hypothetical protein HS088_TW01G00554 [Tripterygium wilfordii]